jgi:O-glycosyl hydrolase
VQPDRETNLRGLSRRGLLRASVAGSAAAAFGLGTTTAARAAGGAVTIDSTRRLQTIRGWGTALSWGANAIGDWQDVDARKEIVDLLFDRRNGLGLNIARYNIGATEDPAHDHMRLAASIPSLMPKRPGEWDLTSDAAQRWVLERALDGTAEILEGFVTSPHYWWTNSGCTAGAVDGGDNLNPAHFDDFVDYVTEVVRVFDRTWGIEFDSLSPINEPRGPWWIALGRQEGCAYALPTQLRVLDAVHRALERKGLAGRTHLAMPDEPGQTLALESVQSYGDKLARLGQVNTHSYWGGNRTGLRDYVRGHSDAELWMSEWGAGGNAGYQPQHISSALNLSQGLLLDLKQLQPDAWCIWNAVESVEANRDENVSWGIIHATYTPGQEDFYVTKQYYGFANYVKFLRPGSFGVPIDDPNAFAAYDPQRRQLVVVYTESGGADREITLDLGGFRRETGAAVRYRTSTNENLAKLPAEQYRDGVYRTTVKGESITTFTFPGLQPR